MKKWRLGEPEPFILIARYERGVRVRKYAPLVAFVLCLAVSIALVVGM